jgi:hypothetical protein
MLNKPTLEEQCFKLEAVITFHENSSSCCYPEASLLNKGSCLAEALGVTKFMNMVYLILVSRCCAT